MDDLFITIMRIALFISGLVTFLILVLKSSDHNRDWKSLGIKLTCALTLIVLGIFSDRITSLSTGPDGLKLEFNQIQTAAISHIEENPEVAEAITGETGQKAVTEAIALLQNSRTADQIKTILPFQVKQNTIKFKPVTAHASSSIKMGTLPSNNLQTNIQRRELAF